jgi:hypothetical protein
VNRFLLQERYEPKDLFDTVNPYISLAGGVISVDDTVVEKPYSNPMAAELIGYFWSGKHHQTIKGINLITLSYSDTQDNSLPINYRIYDKQEGKTKNEYFRTRMHKYGQPSTVNAKNHSSNEGSYTVARTFKTTS